MIRVWNSSSENVRTDTIKILMGEWIIQSVRHLKNSVWGVCSLMLSKSHPVGPSMEKGDQESGS